MSNGNKENIGSIKEIQKILKISEEKNFKEGEVIFKEGEVHPNFYIILKGNVEISKKTTEGLLKVIAQIGAGEFLGEGALSGTIKKPATAQAVTDVAAVVISIKSFEKLMEENPRTVVDFLLSVLQAANTRLAETNTILLALYEMSRLMDSCGEDLKLLANGIIDKLVAITESKDGIFLLKNPFSTTYRVIYSSSEELNEQMLTGYDLGKTQNVTDKNGQLMIVNLKDLGCIVLRRSVQSALFNTSQQRLIILVAEQAAATIKDASDKASMKAKKMLERKRFEM